MLLTYRGVSYNYTPNPRPRFAPVFAIGTYRGGLVPFRILADRLERPSFDLTWRGVHYQSGSDAQAAIQATIPPVVAPETHSDALAEDGSAVVINKLSLLERIRRLVIRRHRRIRQREQSMLARLNEKVGLSEEDAAQYESHIQGKSPHDFEGYDRSHTAMS